MTAAALVIAVELGRGRGEVAEAQYWFGKHEGAGFIICVLSP